MAVDRFVLFLISRLFIYSSIIKYSTNISGMPEPFAFSSRESPGEEKHKDRPSVRCWCSFKVCSLLVPLAKQPRVASSSQPELPWEPRHSNTLWNHLYRRHHLQLMEPSFSFFFTWRQCCLILSDICSSAALINAFTFYN